MCICVRHEYLRHTFKNNCLRITIFIFLLLNINEVCAFTPDKTVTIIATLCFTCLLQ